MKLSTINRWLRRIGLVLVLSLEVDDGVPANPMLWVETARSYDRRAAQ